MLLVEVLALDDRRRHALLLDEPDERDERAGHRRCDPNASGPRIAASTIMNTVMIPRWPQVRANAHWSEWRSDFSAIVRQLSGAEPAPLETPPASGWGSP